MIAEEWKQMERNDFTKRCAAQKMLKQLLQKKYSSALYFI